MTNQARTSNGPDPDATIRIGNTEVELTIGSEISDATKRGIDELYDRGFDPDYDPAKDLLLPQSCAPKVGEHCIVEQDEPVCDFVARIRKIISSVDACETLAFDIVDREKLIALEEILKKQINDLRMKAISIKTTYRMRQAMLHYSGRN